MINVERSHGHAASGGRDAGELAALRAAEREACGDFVPFGHLVFHGDVLPGPWPTTIVCANLGLHPPGSWSASCVGRFNASRKMVNVGLKIIYLETSGKKLLGVSAALSLRSASAAATLFSL